MRCASVLAQSLHSLNSNIAYPPDRYVISHQFFICEALMPTQTYHLGIPCGVYQQNSARSFSTRVLATNEGREAFWNLTSGPENRLGGRGTESMLVRHRVQLAISSSINTVCFLKRMKGGGEGSSLHLCISRLTKLEWRTVGFVKGYRHLEGLPPAALI
jgi:hypothetical protein